MRYKAWKQKNQMMVRKGILVSSPHKTTLEEKGKEGWRENDMICRYLQRKRV